MNEIRFGIVIRVVAALTLLAVSPAAQAEDAATTGILAGLGLSAAAGKTTLGDSAGGIEAGLYGTEGFQQAGAIIASVVNYRRNRRPVLMMAHGDTIDLMSPMILRDRIDLMTKLVQDRCRSLPKPISQIKPKVTVSKNKSNYIIQMELLDANAVQAVIDAATGQKDGADTAKKSFIDGKLSGADLAGVAKVDTTINGISLTADDRMLLTAVVMNGRRPAWEGTADKTGWTLWPPRAGKEPATVKASASTAPAYWNSGDYFIPGEAVGMPADKDAAGNASFYAAYRQLVETTTKAHLTCDRDDGKVAIKIADEFINSLNAADKGPTPLVSAIQADVFVARKPLILRLAVEQTGGTAISRSGLLYTLGLPNAATVGAGLIASFRLIDPAGGGVLAIGIVRCAARQSNIKKLSHFLEHREWFPSATQPRPIGDTTCDFRVAA